MTKEIGWQPATSAPTDGSEFQYITRGSNFVFTGSLASDCGGEIKRDRDMLAWRWPVKS